MKKKYYKISFTLLEPLSLGSGENQYSDSDLLRDSSGHPFIPGSSLCGCYREIVGEELAREYFGERQEDGSSSESKVVVYDAVLAGSYMTQIRDSVGLDEFKVSKDKAKFDFEMIEPGAKFVTYIEQTRSGEEEDIGALLAAAFSSGDIFLGRKTTRGYGKVRSIIDYGDGSKNCVDDLKKNQQVYFENDDIFCREFQLDFSKTGDGIKKWLQFDLYAPDAFTDENKLTKDKIEEAKRKLFEIRKNHEDVNSICLLLRLLGGISIRQYTTELVKDNQQPDYVQMYYKKNDVMEPCIPGTSWAGAFRHQIEKMLPEQDRSIVMHDWFGMKAEDEEEKSTEKPAVKDEKDNDSDDESKKKSMRRSAVRFTESRLSGGEWKIKTRNAIDRFTGGTVDGALYTEKTYFGGTTKLEISYSKKMAGENADVSLWNRLLATAVTDLDQGFLAVGGLTSVGHGLFKVQKCCVNGTLIYKESDKDIIAGDSVTPRLYTELLKKLNEKHEGETR